ncbi:MULTISPECIES: hypothetical protein [unclassified Methylobacterium]|nr:MULTISPECIES: hypothetical protein [unclassified Methylobacterium]MCJ2096744.1 hypothetical protein [Methylobacterium sp. J-072]MCJ2141195.1 hypothetical protein [Methylobacterium sp. E-066]
MSALTIGLGVACCAAGAAAHFFDPTQRKEGLFGLAAFGLLLTGMFLSRS